MASEAVLHLRATVAVLDKKIEDARERQISGSGDPMGHAIAEVAYSDCRTMLQKILAAIDK